MGTILIRDSHGQRCTAWTPLKLEYKSSLSITICLLYSCF